MAKVSIKLDKQFFSELTGSLSKSVLGDNKKFLGIFDMINNHKKDDKIDIKEITDFTNSIFEADTKLDGEISEAELKTYVKNNENKFKELKIKAQDIIDFLNTFRTNADKSDEKSRRINNADGTYSIVYEDTVVEQIDSEKSDNKSGSKQIESISPKRNGTRLEQELESIFYENKKSRPTKTTRTYTVMIKQNFDSSGKLVSTETINGNKTTITDANGNFVAEQTHKKGVLVSERKADGLTYSYNGDRTSIHNGRDKIKEFRTLPNGEQVVLFEKKDDGLDYYYEENKTTIKRGGILVKEIITLENGQTVIKEYEQKGYGKYTVTTINQDTGEVTKETIYPDYYSFTVRPGNVTDLKDMKEIINKPISSDTLSTFLWNGRDIINVLAKEDDDEFKQTYITGMVNKAIEIANLIGVNSNELKTIQKEISDKGFENVSIDKIHNAYSATFDRIEKQNPEISDSQIKNEYYTSNKSYKKIVTNNTIVIIDKDTNKKTNINLTRLLSPFNKAEREQIISAFKIIPAEALLDLAVEATFNNEYVGDGADGTFNYVLDRISLHGGSCSAETILHELGHAVDCKGKGSENNYQTKINAKFRRAFREEIAAFEADGNKRCISYYDSKGGYHTKNDTYTSAKSNKDSTYATLNEQEMFAECYALLMYGSNKSEEVINKYFKKTRDCVLEMIQNTRKLSNAQRHIA